MSELTTVARPYAEAVARMAQEAHAWGPWSEWLALMRDVVQQEDVAVLIDHPEVTQAQLTEVLLAICAERLSAEAANLLRLLVENKRLSVLPEIVRLYEEIRAEQEGVLEARIVSAYPLTEEQLAMLAHRLEARFGRRIHATQEVDPDLIGGVVIHVGDEVLDASVRGKLAELAATLAA